MAPRPIDPTVHIPEEGSYYYRSFWGSYKGHAMGLVRGVLTGGVFGGITGGAVIAGMAALGAPLALPLAVAGAFMGGGALLGVDIMGTAGHSAGAAAAATAEEELRLRYPGSGDGIANSVESPLTGDGHHYETLFKKPKIFHFDVGIPMGLLFAAMGGVLAASVITLASPAALGLIALHGAAASLSTIGGITALCGALGASFGVDRAYFKSLFNQTDEWVNGNLLRTKNAVTPEQELTQELTKEAAEGKAKPVITTLERQDEFHRLYSDYFEKSFWSAITGNTKGLIGGIAIGALIGVALGLLVAAAIPALATGATALTIVLATTALGAHEGMHIFTRAGIDGGAQAAAKEALEVKRQRLQKGLDPESEPAAPEKSRLFNPRTALVGAGVGLAAGAVLGPVVGFGIGEMFGAAGAVHGSALAGLTHLTALGSAHFASEVVGGTAISSLMGATMGAGTGLGLPAYKALSRISDGFYGGRIMRSFENEHETRKIPYLAPNSPWVPDDEKLQQKTAGFTIPNQPISLFPQQQTLRMNTAPQAPALIGTAQSQAAAVIQEPTAQAEAPTRSFVNDYPSTKPMNERIQHIIQSRMPGQEKPLATTAEKLRREAQASAQIDDPGIRI